MAGRVSDEAMFEAAFAVISEQGYERATTRAIADAAGVNEATLFRRFTSKKDLLHQAVHSNLTKCATELDEPGDDVATDLITIVGFCARLFEMCGGAVSALMREAEFSPEMTSMHAELKASLKKAIEIILHHQRRGALIVESPQHTLFTLVGPVMTRTLVWQTDRQVDQTLTDHEAVVQRFLHGHLPG